MSSVKIILPVFKFWISFSLNGLIGSLPVEFGWFGLVGVSVFSGSGVITNLEYLPKFKSVGLMFGSNFSIVVPLAISFLASDCFFGNSTGGVAVLFLGCSSNLSAFFVGDSPGFCRIFKSASCGKVVGVGSFFNL